MYKCELCIFSSNHQANYLRHNETNKHKLKLALISPKLALVSPKLAEVAEIKCIYCDTIFRHKSSLSKHVKYTCKKNKDEDLLELV